MNFELIDKTRIIVGVIFFFIWGCYGFVLPEFLGIAFPIGVIIIIFFLMVYYFKNTEW